MDAIRNGNYKCSSVTFVKFLLFVHAFRLSLGQSDPPYVAVLRSPVATTENPTVIQVYRGTRDATVEFDKAVLRGRDLSNQTYFFRENTPPVSVQSVINRTSEPAILILPTTLTPSQRSGIYTISVKENGGTFLWRVLVTNENATVRALKYSTVVSRGDPVTVSVEAESEIRLNWRRNGEWYTRFGNQSMPCANTLSCTDNTIFPGMFVFECHGGGAYPRQEHALMNVIVRECEHNKWGPPGCMNDCQPCINGGICSVLTGSCLCPPGFSGNHCENVHGSNVFGQNAEYRCDDSGDDHSNGCQGAMICYPNPFGCICPAGYTGLDCIQSCERGMFGANCEQECHCANNSLCAPDTGACQNGTTCESGYRGTNCQLLAVCPVGLYGDFCNIPCTCETEDCGEVETSCTNGCAVPWTGSACNQNTGDGIINLSYIKVNTGQVSAVRCSVIRNPPVSEGDLLLSFAGTPCADCDNENSDRSYNLTKTVMITLSTPQEVTCSVRNTNLMETTMLTPYVPPAYASFDVLTFHDVTSTTITVRWPPWNDMNDIGDGPTVDYRIQMRENGTEAFSNASKGTHLAHQFLDLTPDTLYEFRIILVREGQGGEGAASNAQTQKTLPDGQSDPPYVAVVRSPVATKSNSTVIEVYRGTGDVEFDKAKYINEDKGLKFDSNLPEESVINTTTEPATLLLPATLTPKERTGIYTISVGRNSQAVRWRVLVTNEDATTRAVDYSTVASSGDNVSFRAETDSVPIERLRWRRDGLWNPSYGGRGCNSSLSCGVDNATAGSNVVFECFRGAEYLSSMHAIMNVITRECGNNKWGPPDCMEDCQPCINGGICSDFTGSCLCPPGFSGDHCEDVHGMNVFGQNAEYKCEDSSDGHFNGCQGALICYPNPFGCICPAGYTGVDCMEPCGEGTFGANCKQQCHCKDNYTCATDTGVCENDECESGYKGTNCQLLVVCPPGVYGDFCNKTCSCETEDCSDVEDNCAAGCAIPWTGSACNENTGDGIIQLPYIKVNPGQVTAVRCSVIRNPRILEGDLILSLNGTPCTDCDNQNSDRSYNQTKAVMITLITPVEVTCSVNNTNNTETITLMPHVLPAYPSSGVLRFSNVTSASISVEWPAWNETNDIGDGPIVDYKIQMRENGTAAFSNKSKGTDLVHKFLDLTPDTLYEFRIILMREGQGGEGAPSNVQRQRTLCDVFPSVTELSVAAEEQGQLDVTWNRPESDCSITSYTVNYHLLGYFACLLTLEEEQNDTEITTYNTSYKIRNLSNYANYSVTVRTNQNGEKKVITAITNQSTPSDAPMNIQLVRSSATELEFSWDPPRCQSHNGIITSYSYILQIQENRTVAEGNTAPQEVAFANLIPQTEYSFVVRASTSVGLGPLSDVIMAITDPVPGPPRNVIVTDRSETSLTIEWSMPVNLNGSIIHYQLQFRAIEKLYDPKFVLGAFGQSINVSTQSEINMYVLNGLEPSTLYEIKLFAVTSVERGDDAYIKESTDLYKDLQPLTTLPEIDFTGTTATMTLPALNQLYASGYYIRVQIRKSADQQKRDVDGFGPFSQNPDHYTAAEVEKNEQEMEFTLGDGEMYGGYFNAPLQEETNYNAHIGIGSKAGEDVVVTWSKPIAFGPCYSKPVTMCKDSLYFFGSKTNVPVVIIAVVVAVVIVSVFVLGGFVYCKRSTSETVNEEHELGAPVANPSYDTASSSSAEKLSDTNEEERPSGVNVYQETSSQTASSHVIKLSDLSAYVRQRKEDSENNFFTEFQTLPTDKLYSCKVAESPENQKKNRYTNIIPYDNSRVVLETVDGDSHSDYINASYIDGYMSPKKFIAAQGPKKITVIDFWRMVWQEDVARIVMVTPLFEGKTQKCSKYWSDEDIVLGEILVKCQKVEKHSNYTHRTFYVSSINGGESRRVEHFHFNDWQDMHGLEFLDPTLELLRIVRNDYTERGGCTIVHCSAGVGRTGTYITLDAMLDMAQAEQQINVYEFVKQLRHRRINSVQAKVQYEFIFDTLVKHFYIGRTTMHVESFRSELRDLKQVNSGTGNTFIMDQYKKLQETTCVARTSDVQKGAKEENKENDLSSKLLQVETDRPMLMTTIAEDESNYLNVTFLNGYKQKDFFIATQMPLKDTIVDFWRLVWDFNCSVIITLNSLEKENEQFWPDSSSVTFSPFTVAPLSSDYSYSGNVCVRKVDVFNADGKFQKYRTIHQIQCIDWPNHEIIPTKSSEVLIDCTRFLKKFCSENRVQHVLVHCIDGVGWTGVFCGLVAALDQARAEQEVDIFQLVANMRKAQPLMIKNLEQYQCIFDSVLSYLESDGNYQNL